LNFTIRITERPYMKEIDVYERFRMTDLPFILESREKMNKKGRFTFVGGNPLFRIKIGERGVTMVGETSIEERILDSLNHSTGNPFSILRAVMNCMVEGIKPVSLPSISLETSVFLGGLVGYISHDTASLMIGESGKGTGGKIFADFAFYDKVVVLDHVLKKMFIVEFTDRNSDILGVFRKSEGKPKKEVCRFVSGDMEKLEFVEKVEKARDYIMKGDVFQLVISRKLDFYYEGNIRDVYNRLRLLNPSPYMFFLDFNPLYIFGSSPETLVSVHNGKVIINPIAGTCPRGRNSKEDEELARKLLENEKERAEHVMLVDLARNDVRKVSKPGSVRVRDFMQVVKYSHVQHIESMVEGELDNNKDQFDAVEAGFPAGTVTGAPKLRAIELINSLENSPRGIYGGTVGYFSINGNADFAIAIRTCIYDSERKIATLRAGAGIVADSVPEKEYRETEHKMMGLKKALGL